MKSFAGIAITIVFIIGGIVFAWFSEHRLGGSGDGGEDIARLREENEKLRIELELLQGQVCVQEAEAAYVRARVYAEYPWNNRELIVLDRGARDGLREGMPVVTESGFVVGKVASVWKSTAEVQTVFDSSWKSSVAIGTEGARAVLTGGTEPRLTLIPEDAVVAVGDPVVNTSPGLPLDTPFGRIKEVKADTGEVWKSALVSVPYREERVTTVLVRTDFP